MGRLCHWRWCRNGSWLRPLRTFPQCLHLLRLTMWPLVVSTKVLSKKNAVGSSSKTGTSYPSYYQRNQGPYTTSWQEWPIWYCHHWNRRNCRGYRIASVYRGCTLALQQPGEKQCDCGSPKPPYLVAAGELMTKPTQHSVKTLMESGLKADVLVCRTDRDLPDDLCIKKACPFLQCENEVVIQSIDVSTILLYPSLMLLGRAW